MVCEHFSDCVPAFQRSSLLCLHSRERAIQGIGLLHKHLSSDEDSISTRNKSHNTYAYLNQSSLESMIKVEILSGIPYRQTVCTVDVVALRVGADLVTSSLAIHRTFPQSS